MASPPNNSFLTSQNEVDNVNDKDNTTQLMLTDRDPAAGDLHFNIPPPVPALIFDTTTHSHWNNPATGQPKKYPPSSCSHHSTSTSRRSSGSGPRRGSFPNIIPPSVTPPPPTHPPMERLTAPDLPDSTSMPLPIPDPTQGDSHPQSGPDFRFSGPSRMSQAPGSASAAASSADDSMITVASAQDAHVAPSTSTPPQFTSRRNKQYVLPDGSIVSGKGLGRGRPGIKRGPRNPKYPIVDNTSPQMASVHGVLSSSTDLGRASKKLKSEGSENPIIKARASTSESVTTASRESSEEYNPSTTQTRSGRQTQRPVSLAATTTASASPSRKPSHASPANNATATPPGSVKTHPKIKRRVYRGREQFALCEHCLRGYGPPGNVIVFCDACNKCWHQRCHDPQISKQTVSDSKADWFCAECDQILHSGKKGKKIPSKTNSPPAAAAPTVVNAPPVYTGPRVGGRTLHSEQKLGYLQTLSKDDLMSLVMQASELAPDLPLFETPVPAPQLPSIPQAPFTSSYVTPVSKPPAFADSDAANSQDALDEGYDGYYDEHAALYPKPGSGIKLPPESEDLHILLEGKDSRTFSHWFRGMPGKEFSGTGNINMS
ncbi:uncharacterized protein Z518_06526 [Rhinocladiella mackenziei CBS 650.93]|uniref:Rhinocladiella mackenziei CBS 650.93 unplaced genomic scaffold supercont1.5, whole genome shotgun sequence n=1 Tax=Rhinocladiella mackenziei CBS 650.93 TaxID=1442369 RepID=A0A0D2II85_9EURO|nr:uncharacterized protein Z518_06526 [Rhinocladiella mackenziei CBS 650.93]KIX02976.1 hypothetical protein Z518_06526 [Rhinocladiella mackenziei CBS 650.93]